MPHFEGHDGASLCFDDQGDGPVVLLLHGFVGDVNIDWVRSGMLDRLLDEGYRTIAYDARGHGLSDKPHDPAAYSGDALERDAAALLDALGIASCAVVGFSLGALTALRLVTIDDRVRAVVALGLGEGNLRPADAEEGDGGHGGSITDALLADDPDTIDAPVLRHYREMADAIRADRVALAALMAASRPGVAELVDDVRVPVLVVTGRDDPIGDPAALAARLPGGTAVSTPGDHAGVKGQPAAHEAIVAFLAEHR